MNGGTPRGGRSRRTAAERRRETEDAIARADGSARLTAVRATSTDPLRVTVFVDRARLLTLPRDDARAAGAAAGAAFTPELAGALADAWRRDQALRGAVRLLAARQRSRRGLIDALRAKGHSPAAAEAAAAEMSRRGALDEEAFAASAARAAARRPVGRSSVEAGLARKGVPRELASRAADEALAGRDALADATALAERALRSMPKELARDAVVRRISGRLARRGFAGDVVRRAVRAAMEADRGG